MRAQLLVVSALALVACSPAAMMGTDSGPPPDRGSTPTGAIVPIDNFGSSEGANLRPVTLTACDGTDYEFYGQEEGYFNARFTVFGIAAGWCNPCRAEASMMQQSLVNRYGPQGVRVVVAITQNNSYQAPDNAFCQGWVDQYSLTNAVTTDPVNSTGIYFPAGSLPANMIIDSQGRIRHHEVGLTTGLVTVTARLDQLLAENP
jgi:hypothetical protein